MDRRTSESYNRENIQTRIRQIFKKDSESYEQRILSRRDQTSRQKVNNDYMKYSGARRQLRQEDNSQSDEEGDQPLYLAHTEFDLSKEEERIITQIIACSAMPCKHLSEMFISFLSYASTISFYF